MPQRGWKKDDPPKASPDRGHGGHAFDDNRRGPRLQKVLAEAGVGSRRACEELITTGAVTVNGHLVDTLPAWVDPRKDHINVNGKHVKPPTEHIYVMLFKPRGVVCTNDDPEGRTRAVDLVQHPTKARLYTIGRLDQDSSGLVLLTNDGELANRLMHPRHGVHKTYDVTVKGSLDEEGVAKLERGVFLSDRRTTHGKKPGKKTRRPRLTLVRRDRDRTRLRMELHEGRNRQVRRMMLYVGHPVKKLRRTQIGPVKLRGLRPGQWRDLLPEEIKALRDAAFVKKAQ